MGATSSKRPTGPRIELFFPSRPQKLLFGQSSSFSHSFAEGTIFTESLRFLPSFWGLPKDVHVFFFDIWPRAEHVFLTGLLYFLLYEAKNVP
jgi:hypothetical protein